MLLSDNKKPQIQKKIGQLKSQINQTIQNQKLLANSIRQKILQVKNQDAIEQLNLENILQQTDKSIDDKNKSLKSNIIYFQSQPSQNNLQDALQNKKLFHSHKQSHLSDQSKIETINRKSEQDEKNLKLSVSFSEQEISARTEEQGKIKQENSKLIQCTNEDVSFAQLYEINRNSIDIQTKKILIELQNQAIADGFLTDYNLNQDVKQAGEKNLQINKKQKVKRFSLSPKQTKLRYEKHYVPFTQVAYNKKKQNNFQFLDLNQSKDFKSISIQEQQTIQPVLHQKNSEVNTTLHSLKHRILTSKNSEKCNNIDDLKQDTHGELQPISEFTLINNQELKQKQAQIINLKNMKPMVKTKINGEIFIETTVNQPSINRFANDNQSSSLVVSNMTLKRNINSQSSNLDDERFSSPISPTLTKNQLNFQVEESTKQSNHSVIETKISFINSNSNQTDVIIDQYQNLLANIIEDQQFITDLGTIEKMIQNSPEITFSKNFYQNSEIQEKNHQDEKLINQNKEGGQDLYTNHQKQQDNKNPINFPTCLVINSFGQRQKKYDTPEEILEKIKVNQLKDMQQQIMINNNQSTLYDSKLNQDLNKVNLFDKTQEKQFQYSKIILDVNTQPKKKVIHNTKFMVNKINSQDSSPQIYSKQPSSLLRMQTDIKTGQETYDLGRPLSPQDKESIFSPATTHTYLRQLEPNPVWETQINVQVQNIPYQNLYQDIQMKNLEILNSKKQESSNEQKKLSLQVDWENKKILSKQNKIVSYNSRKQALLDQQEIYDQLATKSDEQSVYQTKKLAVLFWNQEAPIIYKNNENPDSIALKTLQTVSLTRLHNKQPENFILPQINQKLSNDKVLVTLQNLKNNLYKNQVNLNDQRLKIQKLNEQQKFVLDNREETQKLYSMKRELVTQESQTQTSSQKQKSLHQTNFKSFSLNQKLDKFSNMESQADIIQNTSFNEPSSQALLNNNLFLNEPSEFKEEVKDMLNLNNNHFEFGQYNNDNSIFVSNRYVNSRKRSQQISEIYTRKLKNEGSLSRNVLKSQRRVTLNQILSPDQMELFNQLTATHRSMIEKSNKLPRINQ